MSRAGSPFLAHLHSRQSSITSQVSHIPEAEEEPVQGPWDVVRWTKLRKISGQAFSEIGKRNFGRPTCLAVSTSIVVGTSKGIILVFDYQQSLKTIIGTGTQGVCNSVCSILICMLTIVQLLNAVLLPLWRSLQTIPRSQVVMTRATSSPGRFLAPRSRFFIFHQCRPIR